MLIGCFRDRPGVLGELDNYDFFGLGGVLNVVMFIDLILKWLSSFLRGDA